MLFKKCVTVEKMLRLISNACLNRVPYKEIEGRMARLKGQIASNKRGVCELLTLNLVLVILFHVLLCHLF